jgi:HEAT repeat protein
MMPLFGAPDVEKLKAVGDVRRLVRALRYRRSPEVRRQAAKALGNLAETDAVEPLIAALHDDDSAVRVGAVRALGQIGDRRAVEPLITSLWDLRSAGARASVKWYVADEAARALVHINDGGAIPELLEMVRYNKFAGKALVGIRDPQAVPLLLEALADDNTTVRRVAAMALGGEDRSEVAGALTALLDDDNLEVRQAAVDGLVRTGQAAVEPLANLLTDGDPAVRGKAASVLGQIGGETAAAALVAALTDAGGPTVEVVEKALQNTGEAGLQPLLDQLLGPEGTVRERAARMLPAVGWRPERTEVGAVYHLVRREWDRCAAVGAAAVSVLARALEDPDAEVRASAARALGSTGLGRAVEPLITFLHGEQTREGREAAAQALEALYGSGRLTEDDRLRILGQREHLRALHEDVPGQHQDDPFGRYKNWGSDCTHADRMAVPHTDEGIKVRLGRGRKRSRGSK